MNFSLFFKEGIFKEGFIFITYLEIIFIAINNVIIQLVYIKDFVNGSFFVFSVPYCMVCSGSLRAKLLVNRIMQFNRILFNSYILIFLYYTALFSSKC